MVFAYEDFLYRFLEMKRLLPLLQLHKTSGFLKQPSLRCLCEVSHPRAKLSIDGENKIVPLEEDCSKVKVFQQVPFVGS